MRAQSAEKSAELLCTICGYDLRAHPLEGKCPECGTSVAESRRLAAIPRRPAWRDSDPRWRRRMLAGVWILVFLPLLYLLAEFECISNVAIPTVFDFRGALILNETFLWELDLYESLTFCIGVVLLFSNERGRWRSKLDWTRRWGIVCSYVVLLLHASQVLYVTAFMLAGIAMVFLSMPLKYQPDVTQWFVDVSTIYIHYGMHPKDISVVVLAAFSSFAMLLACVPLFDALRSSGPRWVAAVLLAPLALFSLMHLADAGRYCLVFSSVTGIDVYFLATYFRPLLLSEYVADDSMGWFMPLSLSAFVVEAVKWCIILAIALRLSIAQFAAWRQAKG